MSDPAPTTTVYTQRGGQGCAVTLLWFIFVGWWFSAIRVAVAWFLVTTSQRMELTQD